MSFVSDFFKDISGRTARDASKEAGRVQAGAAQQAGQRIEQGGQQALGYFSPYAQALQPVTEQVGFLTDPQQQYAWLQNNPLFQAALENANRGTQAQAAAGGRLSYGDTLQRLSQNVLLSASPLIANQQQNISNLLGMGLNTAGQQAAIGQNTAANVGNMITGAGAAQAGGIVGAGNAMAQGSENVLNLAGKIVGMF